MKLCRQVSIESPGPPGHECVFSFSVPVPETPPEGCRVRVVCAGACYRPRRSLSTSSEEASPAHGVRDSALFAGFEVAGVVESVGENAVGAPPVGERVCIYPFDDLPQGYAEFVAVPDPQHLIPLPSEVSLSVAAMLPSGALRALSTFREAQKTNPRKLLVVGTGGLALWTVRIAQCLQPELQVTVASLRDEGFLLAQASGVNVVQWDEDLYEKYLIERTVDACSGPVDAVIDYGTTSRSLHRSLQCLSDGGVALLSDEVAERLVPKFAAKAKEHRQLLQAVPKGSVQQLREVVDLVASGRLEPPPHAVFPLDEAPQVVARLSTSDIPGRAILRFLDIN
ncbi:uncharacterized protein LOC129793892 [Lutzomyia longipalpis]|uniref:uncharacterized protein LOC129793892 n=1 Tax=Lutzomyia longipalpis TaxID=7200 RepID=UPI0024846DC4|nr:uncharacterized protein LOC129793892 [Lutzomyia longipalpis]